MKQKCKNVAANSTFLFLINAYKEYGKSVSYWMQMINKMKYLDSVTELSHIQRILTKIQAV